MASEGPAPKLAAVPAKGESVDERRSTVLPSARDSSLQLERMCVPCPASRGQAVAALVPEVDDSCRGRRGPRDVEQTDSPGRPAQ